jgi:hypothetical protein
MVIHNIQQTPGMADETTTTVIELVVLTFRKTTEGRTRLGSRLKVPCCHVQSKCITWENQ